jgi:hypothetical protein
VRSLSSPPRESPAHDESSRFTHVQCSNGDVAALLSRRQFGGGPPGCELAYKLTSGAVVEGLKNKAKSHPEKSTAFAPAGYSNWPFITRLASCPNRNPPAISSDEPHFQRASLSLPQYLSFPATSPA